MSTAYPHRKSRPHNRLHMHDARKIFAAKFPHQPVQPVQVCRSAPVRDPNIYVVSQANSTSDCRSDNARRKETIWPLPHEKQTAIGCLLELKTVRKVEVRIEQYQFCVRARSGVADR